MTGGQAAEAAGLGLGSPKLKITAKNIEFYADL